MSIKVTDKYYIDADRFQFIALEKKTAKEGKNAGKEWFDPVAFCGNLFQLKNWIFNQEIRDNIELINNISKCVELSNTIDKSLMGVGKK